MSGVRFQVSGVGCQVLVLILNKKIKIQICEASWWRVCYQRGLPHLLFFFFYFFFVWHHLKKIVASLIHNQSEEGQPCTFLFGFFPQRT